MSFTLSGPLFATNMLSFDFWPQLAMAAVGVALPQRYFRPQLEVFCMRLPTETLYSPLAPGREYGMPVQAWPASGDVWPTGWRENICAHVHTHLLHNPANAVIVDFSFACVWAVAAPFAFVCFSMPLCSRQPRTPTQSLPPSRRCVQSWSPPL